MKQLRLRALFPSLGQSSLCILLGMTAALPAGAQTQHTTETAESFVLDQYYQGKEGNPPSLAKFFLSPMSYLRSEEAYTALRAHFASVRRESDMSKSDFEALYVNGEVRLRSCAETGPFRTDGIVPNGTVVQSPRTDCYTNEQFIELLVGTEWKVVASQSCFNPVRLVPPAPPPKEELTCVRVSMDVTVIDATTHMHADGTVHQNCCCGYNHVVPSFQFDMGSTQHADGFYLQCR